MPRLTLRAWGVIVDFAWGIVDVVIETNQNETNSTRFISCDLENQVLNICRCGATAYTSRSLIKDLILNANPILFYY